MPAIIGPREAPHGVTVLLMARYEAEALADFLHALHYAGMITDEDVTDVYVTLRDHVHAHAFTGAPM